MRACTLVRSAAVAAVLLSMLAMASPGRAFDGYAPYGGIGWNSYWGWTGRGYVPPPPYFAIHPPVYYSHHIVRRPYGISPYAAPAGVLPAEFAVRQVVENPYFVPEVRTLPALETEPLPPPVAPEPPAAPEDAGELSPASHRLEIVNPFYVPRSLANAPAAGSP